MMYSVRAFQRRSFRKARKEEIQWFHNKGVYHKISRAEAKKNGWPIIGVRWVDVNKGDDKNPVYRSRLVAEEFKRIGLDDDDLFAGTPPLEALKLLISAAATTGAADGQDRCMLIADVSRAFFEAAATRNVCVEIVQEDRTPEDDRLDLVGKLDLSMYGTRDAPAN